MRCGSFERSMPHEAARGAAQDVTGIAAGGRGRDSGGVRGSVRNSDSCQRQQARQVRLGRGRVRGGRGPCRRLPLEPAAGRWVSPPCGRVASRQWWRRSTGATVPFREVGRDRARGPDHLVGEVVSGAGLSGQVRARPAASRAVVRAMSWLGGVSSMVTSGSFMTTAPTAGRTVGVKADSGRTWPDCRPLRSAPPLLAARCPLSPSLSTAPCPCQLPLPLSLPLLLG